MQRVAIPAIGHNGAPPREQITGTRGVWVLWTAQGGNPLKGGPYLLQVRPYQSEEHARKAVAFQLAMDSTLRKGDMRVCVRTGVFTFRALGKVKTFTVPDHATIWGANRWREFKESWNAR